jgi:hypothetical protein
MKMFDSIFPKRTQFLTMNVLLSTFSPSQISPVLSDFCTISDIGKLDSANCNKLLRQKFINLLDSSYLVLNGFQKKFKILNKEGASHSTRYIDWIMTRKVSMKWFSCEVGGFVGFDRFTNLMSDNKTFTQLTHLRMRFNSVECSLSLINWTKFSDLVPQLKSLDLLNCPTKMFKVFRGKSSSCRPFPNLEVLKIEGDMIINDSYEEFVKNMRSLTSFTLSKFNNCGCQRLVLELINAVCNNNAASLTELNVLQGVQRVLNDEQMLVLTSTCPHLTALRLEKCQNWPTPP